jgi:hypothetical protein
MCCAKNPSRGESMLGNGVFTSRAYFGNISCTCARICQLDPTGYILVHEAQLRASDYPQARARVDKSVVVGLRPVTSPIGTETLARNVVLGCRLPKQLPRGTYLASKCR